MKEVFVIKIIPRGENEQLNKQYFLQVCNYMSFKFGTDLCPTFEIVTDLYDGTLFADKNTAETILEKGIGLLDKECLYKIENLYVFNTAFTHSIKD